MKTQAQLAALAKARTALATERQWYDEHGGSLAGYIARYGSASDPEHYGDGGEAIHRADAAAVAAAEARYRQLSWPGPCPCECNSGGFCGGCGHAGCGGRK